MTTPKRVGNEACTCCLGIFLSAVLVLCGFPKSFAQHVSKVLCPAGSYMSDHERDQRQVEVTAFWRERGDVSRPSSSFTLCYEDEESLFPSGCPLRRPLSQTSVVCGVWTSKFGKSTTAKWDCINHRPDAARSEYFLIEPTEELIAPRLIVSRIWKTGSTALGEVFRCLYGLPGLRYANLARHRGPFILGQRGRLIKPSPLLGKQRSVVQEQEQAEEELEDRRRRQFYAATMRLHGGHNPTNYTHVAVVRNPVERLVSGYREILARLTFFHGETIAESSQSRITEHYRDMASRGSSVSHPPILEARAGWPRVAARLDEMDYAWLWAGVPVTTAASAGRAYPAAAVAAGHAPAVGEVRRSFTIDEAARFRAFVDAAECGRAGIWWAHAASASWFLNGPRHVLSLDEARSAFNKSRAVERAKNPADAAFKSRPLPVHFILKQEALAKGLEAALSAVTDTNSAPSFQSKQQQQQQQHSNDNERRSCLRKVLDEARHNTQAGNGGVDGLWRAHVPSSSFYHDVLDADTRQTHNSPKRSLLCRIVAVMRQDYECFGYKVPEQCR